MLHQVNAHFPGTDPVLNRAANIQTALKCSCMNALDLEDKSRKTQTNRNTKKIGKKSTC